MGLARSLAVGLLCSLPLFNAVLAAPTAPNPAAPRSAIAIKLNQSASRARSVVGADVVEDLIRKAQSGSTHAKRDAQFSVLPLITTLTPEKISEMVQRATELNPNYKPADFGSWFQVQFPDSTADEDESEIGEIFMSDNTIGGVGIAHGAEGHVVGVQRTVGGGPVENEAEAIMDAAAYLSAGDVMLLEMQTGDAAGNSWPVEILDAQFDAISLATSLGIIVIEPAANGAQDMDQPVLRIGETTALALLNRDSADFRDSGAIVVGAGSSAAPHSRLSFSNYGNRVDAYSWGENIATSTVNADDQNDDIYDYFDGTSGASPIVAGAALIIQGIVNVNRGTKLTPAEMRSLITVGGTASADPSSDKIGVQPDLRALIDGGHLD
ncbi:peptidase S8/S53 domain-containing protein [Chaetomium fimeti]|uniref:Peptidase S8/S53 domain-containing protein n=1 Tax=Chaetomium fimeti TaxID=1854472 RepID=A0AAE0HEF9_9PEZI|nr:peptidase S8/S53 domain-containing protein [Chaetomium fimeti]